MARKKKEKTPETEEQTTETIPETQLDMKTVLAATIVIHEMHEGLPREVVRAYQSWEAYGKLSDVTLRQVRNALSKNKDGVSFEKRLTVAKTFIDYVFSSTG